MTTTLSGVYQFPRELRLLTPSHFAFVFDNAIPVSSPQLTLLARYNSLEYPRLGITIAKKRVKKAVQRNRIKRLIRETFRHQASTLPNIDIIVIGKSGCDSLTNDDLNRLLRKSWQRLDKRCRQNDQ
ncbi:ribonuclease P protein component [Alteromonas sediminis]|uniref:Ribonuclease P protein component n=1 Tax=Alteromonas sediminis TaxID=2259342 RepID=A0A3N5Y1D5_9ALTE|nr:ribonuclease P protein component [Alteromonas sediminis]RPJ66773.1 ribonuclease P protein component [Alteromonas sediminis]